MAIKSVKSDGPPPDKVAIAYNGDTRFIDTVMKELHKEWNIGKGYWEFNALMPKNSAVIYDRYDCIVVNTVKNKLYYRKISKEERDAALVKASAGRISDPFQS
jgi:hypothetical protein